MNPTFIEELNNFVFPFCIVMTELILTITVVKLT